MILIIESVSTYCAPCSAFNCGNIFSNFIIFYKNTHFDRISVVKYTEEMFTKFSEIALQPNFKALFNICHYKFRFKTK